MGVGLVDISSSRDKAERLRGIKNGKGIQYILDKAYDILGNPLVIHDMEYKLIAHSGGLPADDPFCEEFLATGMLSDVLIEFCMSESFIDSVSYSANNDGVVLLISDKLKYDRVFGQLYNKYKMPVADLIVLESGVSFDDDIGGLVRIICAVLSKELGRNAYYQDYGQMYQEGILKKLIEGSIEDKAIYAGHIANIDAGLKNFIFVTVADAGPNGGDYAALSRLRDLLKNAHPAYKYYVYSNYVIILMSSDNSTLNPRKDLSKLLRLFEKENIYAGVSGGFENLFEMPARYIEAVDVLSDGLQSGGDKRISFHVNRE